jgi:transposase-like protein
MLSESVNTEKKKELSTVDGRLISSEEQVLSVGQSVEPEVIPVAKRRRFTTEYKLSVLEEADQCTESGQIGLLLRREGLYSNSLYNWRKWRDKLNQKKDKSESSIKEIRNENARLKRENARLHLKLKKADALLNLQKKASEILQMADLDESEDD